MGVHDREDARDANPLVNALPAQCTSRRKPRIELASVEVDGGSVIIDRKTVFAMKPETRAKWLVSALKYAALGEVRPVDVYDIIASNRFVEDLPPKVGRKMGRAVQEQLHLFSAKQKRFLTNEAVLIVKFGAQDNNDSKMEDMMARCRAFVREKALERGDMKEKDPSDSQLPSVAATDSHAAAPAATGAPPSKEDSAKDRGGREKGKPQQRSGRRTRSSSGSESSARSKAGGNKKPRVQRKRSRSRSSSSAGSAKRAAATAAARGRRKAQQHRRRGSSSSEERSRRRRARSSSSEPSKKRDAKKSKKKQR